MNYKLHIEQVFYGSLPFHCVKNILITHKNTFHKYCDEKKNFEVDKDKNVTYIYWEHLLLFHGGFFAKNTKYSFSDANRDSIKTRQLERWQDSYLINNILLLRHAVYFKTDCYLKGSLIIISISLIGHACKNMASL